MLVACFVFPQYARARSRVAKSLGLDAPVLQPGARAARQRKVVRYDFDDYDRHMRVRVLIACISRSLAALKACFRFG